MKAGNLRFELQKKALPDERGTKGKSTAKGNWQKSRGLLQIFFLQFANERTKGKDRISVISPFSAPQNGSPFGIKLSNFSL